MRHGSLFSGIGGFDLASRWMGWENVFHCEINPFCQKVLSYHFPESIQHHDITKTDFSIYRGRIDIITGGFPCQPFSVAGKQLGTEDDRHLWPEMLRAIREIQPHWIVGENVRGLVNWSGGMVFEQVQDDLEAEGYEVLPFILPACAVNAPHRRDRVWFVAHAMRSRYRGRTEAGRSDKFEEREIHPHIGQHGDGVWGEAKRCSEVAKNTMHSGRIQRESEQEGAEIREQRDVGTGGAERICVSEGTTSETTGFRGNKNEGMGYRKSNEFNKISNEEFTTNAQNTGLPSCNERQREEQFGGRNSTMGERKWENFPISKPTIHSGDDGISDRLDGITFSKWRQESIKAYGNAVVPPLVFEIFKAIEKHG